MAFRQTYAELHNPPEAPLQEAPGQTFLQAPPMGEATQVVYAYQPGGKVVYDKYKSCQSKLTGTAQIVIGVLLIMCNGAALGLMPWGPGAAGHGIWGGVLFIVSGSFGVTAGNNKSKCPVIAYMVLSIVSASVCSIVFLFGVLGSVSSLGYCYYTRSPYCGSEIEVQAAMNVIITILSVLEVAMAIWGSVLCCKVACCGATANMIAVPMQFTNMNGGQIVYLSNPAPQCTGYPAQSTSQAMMAPPYESPRSLEPEGKRPWHANQMNNV